MLSRWLGAGDAFRSVEDTRVNHAYWRRDGVAARGAAQQPATPVTPRESSPDPMFVRAIAAVNEKLKHPQSARYGDMVRKVGPNVNGRPAEVVCGKRKRKRLFPRSPICI